MTSLKIFEDNNHIFYVSSRGHNGTTWLSRSLSLHPDIVCWHGTRSIPPKASNKNEETLSPHEFAKGLAACNSSCQHSKIFGAVHGFWGIDMKIPIEMENGAFLYLVRNPLNAINSNFVFKMKNIFSNITSQDDIKNLMLDLGLNEIDFEFKNDPNKEKKKSISPGDLLPDVSTNIKLNEEQFLVLRQFMISVVEIVFYDYFNISAAGIDKMIKFEEMVSSTEYFEKNVIKKINSDIECSKEYLEIVFNQGVINQHSGQSYDVEQIRKKWLSFQNKIFDFVCFEGIYPIADAYSRAQYSIIPFSLETYIDKNFATLA